MVNLIVFANEVLSTICLANFNFAVNTQTAGKFAKDLFRTFILFAKYCAHNTRIFNFLCTQHLVDKNCAPRFSLHSSMLMRSFVPKKGGDWIH